MADKRYQVFISSTYEDLKEERQAVMTALLQLDAVPSGMELFPAANEEAWTLIERVIDECDYYLLLIAGKYGSKDSSGKSYTQREWEYALSHNKPIMAFLHADVDSLKVNKAEKSEENQALLADFRSAVESQKHAKYWTSAEDLAGKVALSFSSFVKNYPAEGWVRASDAGRPEDAAEINRLRIELASVDKQLRTAQLAPPPGTESLASGTDTHFIEVQLDLYLDDTEDIDRHQYPMYDVETTWNNIIANLGPLLLDEASEGEIMAGLRNLIGYWHGVDIRESLLPIYREQDNEAISIRTAKVSRIPQEEFTTVLIQLMALGIITKSERKHGVNDTNTYWTLTPYGQSLVVRLRALERPKEENEAVTATVR